MSTRRGFLADAAGIAATATPLAAQGGIHPDAELIAIGQEAAPLSAKFQANLAAFFALGSGHPDLQRVADLNDAPCERLDEMVARATQLRASSLEGCAAKAVLLRHIMLMDFGERMDFVSDGRNVTDLSWSLVNDLLGRAGA